MATWGYKSPPARRSVRDRKVYRRKNDSMFPRSLIITAKSITVKLSFAWIQIADSFTTKWQIIVAFGI